MRYFEELSGIQSALQRLLAKLFSKELLYIGGPDPCLPPVPPGGAGAGAAAGGPGRGGQGPADRAQPAAGECLSPGALKIPGFP